MQVSISTFVCAILVLTMLLSCSSDELPIMDSRVVSYKMIRPKEGYGEYLGYGNGFIADQDTLKSWFSDTFNNEQAESECNYFAIYFTTSSTLARYWILSQDMILCKVEPDYAKCSENTDIAYHVMLVCDDTEEGNLKDKINLNSIRSYIDEDWDCRKERKDVFF